MAVISCERKRAMSNHAPAAEYCLPHARIAHPGNKIQSQTAGKKIGWQTSTLPHYTARITGKLLENSRYKGTLITQSSSSTHGYINFAM